MIIIRFLVLILIIYHLSTANAQVITFSRTYSVVTEVASNQGQFTSRPIEFNDKYFFATGARGLSLVEGSKIALYCTDIFGNEKWKWEDSTFISQFYVGNIFEHNGYIYFNYSYTVSIEGGRLGVLNVAKFNLDGNLIWHKDFVTDEEIPKVNLLGDLKVYNNKIYISYSSAYYTGNPQPNQWYNQVAICRLDTAGNMEWLQEHDSGGIIDYNYSLIVGADSAIYLTVITNGLGASGWRGHLIKTDMEGNMIWQKLFNDIVAIMTINSITNSNFILTGINPSLPNTNGRIIEIDTSGQSVKTHHYTFVESLDFYRSSEISDGSLVTVGLSNMKPNENNCGIIQKSTQNGNVIWRHRYDFNEHTDYFIDFIETMDGGLLVTGLAFVDFVTGADTWLVKLDNNGCLEPGCLEVGIEETELEIGITIYPNPTQDRLFIKTEQSQKRPLKFSLYNMQGKLLIQDNLVGEYESFDLSSLVSGVYLVNVEAGEGKRVTKKIVKN